MALDMIIDNISKTGTTIADSDNTSRNTSKSFDFNKHFQNKKSTINYIWPIDFQCKKNVVTLIRHFLWFAIASSILIITALALNTNRIFSRSFDSSFLGHSDAHKSSSQDSTSPESDNYENSYESFSFFHNDCPSRVDRILLFIIDSFSYKSLIDLEHEAPMDNILNIVRQRPQRARLFNIDSGGLLLTNAAIRRMIFGYRCSLIECFDNRRPLDKLARFSLFNEMHHSNMSIEIFGIGIWQTLFQSSFPRVEFNATAKNDEIITSLYQNQLTIVHLGKYDKFIHIYGADSFDSKQKLLHYVTKFTNILNIIDESDDDDQSRTLLLLTGDHGSFEYNHGYDTYVESTIPFFAFVNFDGFFTTKHWSKDVDDTKSNTTTIPRHYVFRANQSDLAPSFALLLGVNINRSSEGDLIGEFFRDDITGQHLVCHYETNAKHLKDVIDRRLYDKDSDKDFDLIIEESINQKNFRYAKYLEKLPKNNTYLLKYVVLLAISLFLLTLFSNTVFAIEISLLFIICGTLYIQSLYVLFAITVLISIILLSFTIYEEILALFLVSYNIIFDIKNLIVLVKLYAMLLAFIPYSSTRYSTIFKVMVTNLIFIIPSLIIILLSQLNLAIKKLFIAQFVIIMAISALVVPFSKCKPTFYHQRCLYLQVDTIPGIILCIIVAINTMVYLYYGRNVEINHTIYILHLIFLMIFIIFTWSLRDIGKTYKYGTRQYLVYCIFAVHIYGILSIFAALIWACLKSDIKIFYDLSVITIIGICMAIYDLNYSIVFSMIIVFIRSICMIPRLVEYSIPEFESLKRLKDFITIRKIILFNFVFFYKQITDILFYLIGRSNSIHDIYSISMSFRLSIKEESNILTRMYGSMTAFSARIICSFIVSFEIIKYIKSIANPKDIVLLDEHPSKTMKDDANNKMTIDSNYVKQDHLNRHDQPSKFKDFINRYFILIKLFFEAIFSWHSSLILYNAIKLYYYSFNDPKHTWNDSELTLILLLIDVYYDLILFHCNALIFSALNQ